MMANSWKDIDYRVRPAKSIERKMLAESFRRLLHFADPVNYSYLGMGSLYFSDFSLFHRSLGFQTMVSMEDCSDPTIQSRFEMNVPYGHIEMEFSRAGAVLQRKSCWKDAPAVIWLDYDGTLSAECLGDLEYVASNAASGTVLIISVNAEKLRLLERFDDDGNELDESKLRPLQILERNLGEDRVPLGSLSKDLSGWGVAALYRDVIDAAIRKGLTLHPNTSFTYQQIYNFQYKDGARMLTVGGVLFDEMDRARFEAAAFGNMEFVRTSKDAYLIDPPKITYPEMRAINTKPGDLPIPPTDIEKFRRTYRYFPNFIEAEVS